MSSRVVGVELLPSMAAAVRQSKKQTLDSTKPAAMTRAFPRVINASSAANTNASRDATHRSSAYTQDDWLNAAAAMAT
jgi:hypothetical protein